MSMEMALALAAPVANTAAQQPSAAGQETAAGAQNGQFGRLLVARVSDAGAGSGRQSVQPQTDLRLAWNPAGGEWAGQIGGMAGLSLLEQLDGLLRQLESGEPLADSQQAEIKAALEDLLALMNAMFGISIPMPEDGAAAGLNAAGSQADLAADAADVDADTANGSAFRNGIFETIAFVRSFLAEGAFRPLNRSENAIFEALVGRMQRALAHADETARQDADAGNEPQPEIRAAGTETRTSAEALLARKPMQASVAAIVTEAQRQAGANSDAAQTAGQTAVGAGTSAPDLNAQAQTGIAGEATRTAAAEGELTPVAQTVQPQAANAPAEAARTEAPARQPVHTVPVERFHEVISGMAVRQMSLSASNGVSEARILLVPEHLGEVAVRITLQNGQLTAQFMTENAIAKDLIENQFVVLRGALQSQGIQVDRLEVTYGSAAAQSQLFQEQRQRGGHERHEGGRSKRGEEPLTVFETELLEQTAARELGYGRAINVKA